MASNWLMMRSQKTGFQSSQEKGLFWMSFGGQKRSTWTVSNGTTVITFIANDLDW